MESGTLFVVATPIGNLGDLSARGVEVLQQVDLIAAEDTRHTAPLLRHFGVTTPLQALHDHNERRLVDRLIDKLHTGTSIALVSDAGTPLISDPGFQLVRACRLQQIRVSPIPGPSAAVAALSVAGLATDRFRFEGFPPRSHTARRQFFQSLAGEEMTLVFYEASHRVRATLSDMAETFGNDRSAVVARELTKLHETVLCGQLQELCMILEQDAMQSKGEFVLLVAGVQRVADSLSPEAERVVKLLSESLPVKQAARLASEITGERKNLLYQLALKFTQDDS